MKTILIYAFSILMLAGCGTSPARGPVSLDKTASDSFIRLIEKERADTREWLRSSPTSYLAAVNRIDFGEKTTLTVGRAEDNDLILSADDVELHHLTIPTPSLKLRTKQIARQPWIRLRLK
jgi:hypothetical protein